MKMRFLAIGAAGALTALAGCNKENSASPEKAPHPATAPNKPFDKPNLGMTPSAEHPGKPISAPEPDKREATSVGKDDDGPVQNAPAEKQ